MTTASCVSSSRRKGLPRRSPSQNDPSKGIVFSFRFQNDPGLSMAVDIRSYDQQFGPPDPNSSDKMDSKAGPSAGSSSMSLAGSHTLLLKNNSADDTIKVSQGGAAVAGGGTVRMNGGHWSSDPTAYRNSNVYDQTRNLLILHTRKPSPQATTAASGSSQAASGVSSTATAAPAVAQALTKAATTATPATKGTVTPVATSSSSNNTYPAAFHPYRTQRRSSSSSSSQSSSSTSSTSSFPSTPALSQAGSSSSSSASSSPSSPTSPHSLPSSPAGVSGGRQHTKCSGDIGLPMPLTLDALSAVQSTRFLNVRGLGGASRGRRMQVILVS
ncbi:hypothetical protein BGZ47_000196 [Haplosporangium gracile]|nr:hypothetical protein BGZ47_000196 [Haplosporangium gracile]